MYRSCLPVALLGVVAFSTVATADTTAALQQQDCSVDGCFASSDRAEIGADGTLAIEASLKNFSDPPACEADVHEKCASWASKGDCEFKPFFMHQNCRTSCNSCQIYPLESMSLEGVDNEVCVDRHDNCKPWARAGECNNNEAYMSTHCSRSCRLCPSKVFSVHGYSRGADLGVPQTIDQDELEGTSNITEVINSARSYLLEEAPKTNEIIVLDQCTNIHPKCARWAAMGECDANPNYMKKKCAPVCKSCEYNSYAFRCPIDENTPNTWAPGDLNAMFERLTSEPYVSQHSVQILSSPATDGPWVITMDDVVSEAESQTLIRLGTKRGFERSTTIGKMKSDGSYERRTFEGRTSTNAWCEQDCYTNRDTQNVVHRMSNITGIPEANAEYLQLLKYEPGQFYKAHSDYSAMHAGKQSGVRILTMYMYLSDVEAGGGTNFDQLGVTVQPKRGRAVLWPSVTDDDPEAKDPRTTHQALPVEAGTKYGANAWFHIRDYKTPRTKKCE